MSDCQTQVVQFWSLNSNSKQLMIFKDFSVQKINSTNKEGENENSFGKNLIFLLKVKKIKVDHCQMKEQYNHQLILNHGRVISP